MLMRFSQWIVSSLCSSQSCTSYSGPKYSPTGSDDVYTGDSFEIYYLQGYVSGPIWWDEFILGPYALPSQAFGATIHNTSLALLQVFSDTIFPAGAVTTVEDELMSLGFSGILALSFPIDSKIAQDIPPI